MSHYKQCEKKTDEIVINSYTNISKEDLLNNVDYLMTNLGYRKEVIDENNTFYTKGNRIIRILLGAFYKYFKFKITVKEISAEEVKLQVRKESSGMSGGLIGMNQVKNEMNKICEELVLF